MPDSITGKAHRKVHEDGSVSTTISWPSGEEEAVTEVEMSWQSPGPIRSQSHLDKLIEEYGGTTDRTDADQAYTYLKACGLDPTPDAVAQLNEVFLPCLAIMCSRGYDPRGECWRDKGWRNQITEILERADRLLFNVWQRGVRDENNARDIINYAGFLLRSDWSNEWGKFGPPGGGR